MIGQTLGNYRILEKLGEGGMGAVYLADDISLERHVAIKIISPLLARRSELMARFRVEAIAQARLNHSNIVTIHSFDQQNDVYYIVMEYVEGKTLKKLIRDRGKIPEQEALIIISRLLDGLSYAHARGVLHRDIKPANIFVTPENIVKIGDFGIAKVQGIDGLTRVGARLGTPLYSSPEQIRGEKLNAAADIYSVGVTLFEMLTGALPFANVSGSDFEIQQAHLERAPSRPSALNPKISASVDTLVLKSLAKSPPARYLNTAAFKEAVETILHRSPPQGSEAKVVNVKKRPQVSFPLLQFKKIKFPALEGTTWFRRLKTVSFKHFFYKPVSRQIDSIRKLDKRKLLIILIPLLILLLFIITLSAPTSKVAGGSDSIRQKSGQVWMPYCHQVDYHPTQCLGGKK